MKRSSELPLKKRFAVHRQSRRRFGSHRISGLTYDCPTASIFSSCLDGGAVLRDPVSRRLWQLPCGRAILDTVKRTYNVDENRVVLSGAAVTVWARAGDVPGSNVPSPA